MHTFSASFTTKCKYANVVNKLHYQLYIIMQMFSTSSPVHMQTFTRRPVKTVNIQTFSRSFTTNCICANTKSKVHQNCKYTNLLKKLYYKLLIYRPQEALLQTVHVHTLEARATETVTMQSFSESFAANCKHTKHSPHSPPPPQAHLQLSMFCVYQ